VATDWDHQELLGDLQPTRGGKGVRADPRVGPPGSVHATQTSMGGRQGHRRGGTQGEVGRRAGPALGEPEHAGASTK